MGELETTWRRRRPTPQIVGDDFFVTNPKRLATGIEKGACNSILVKVNQIGTLTETYEAVSMAQRAGYTTIISHRSEGGTMWRIRQDSPGVRAAHADRRRALGQIKTGSRRKPGRPGVALHRPRRQVQPTDPD